jgi:imidazole glycerol-phosphate synthase subunit HisH
MGRRIAVIDYGMGNLRSVAKALEHVLGTDDRVLVSADPSTIHAADAVVFPGQGAARDCMAAISEHHLNRAILEAAQSKPFLGICMGLQVLMGFSEENGGTELLKLLPGRVQRFPAGLDDADGRPLKIPHMGWNRVRQTQSHPLWAGIPQDSRFYFVHSYCVVPESPELVAGTTDYGVEFASVLARDNFFAVQFHPEKSARWGLRLLGNFARWEP